MRSDPPARYRRWSLWAVGAASALMLVDTAQLFVLILGEEVVPAPWFSWYSVTSLTAGVVLGAWLIGTIALLVPRSRAAFGWLAPMGASASALADRQAITDTVIYLVVLGSAMHWWSARLRRRDETAKVVGAPLRVLQTQVSVVFAWTAIAKLNERFLSGAVLSVSFSGPLRPPDWLLERQTLMAIAIATVVVEALFAIALWIDTLRPFALRSVVLFHVGIVLVFQPTVPLIAFGSVMGSGYALFAAEPWAAVGRIRAEGFRQ